MKSWLEFETRFRQLKGLEYLRLDMQWGSAGENWSVTGVQITPEVTQFKILAATAGRVLELALPKKSELLKEQHPEIRWYRALKLLSGESLHPQVGFETDRKTGEHIGNIYWDRINNIAIVSANLCLLLHANHPIKDTRTRWKKLYESHGREIIIGIIVALVTAAILAIIGC